MRHQAESSSASPCEIETSIKEKRFNRLHKRLFRAANILFVVTGIQTDVLYSGLELRAAMFSFFLIGMFSDFKSSC